MVGLIYGLLLRVPFPLEILGDVGESARETGGELDKAESGKSGRTRELE
jgi:hypothetical protein